jgi:glycosyltransferase involved in cell wall biosynthesis
LSRRPRVLVIAEAANPEWVSVPLVGWSLAYALREVADVHIVTQVRNRDAFLRAGLFEGKDFTAIDSEKLARPLWKVASLLRMGDGKGWTVLQALNAVSYPYFEHLVWRHFEAGILSGEFDVVHRVTPLSPTIASPIAAKCRRAGVPFVLGPLNGGIPWPKGFNAERIREREWLSYVRGAYRLLPGRRATLGADAILVGSRYTESTIPAAYRDKCVYLPENAVDPTRFSRVAKYSDGPLRACFIGRMVPYKGPDMLLEAAAPLLRDKRITIDLIGDGPLLENLKAKVASDGTDDSVTFHGWLPHEEVQDIVAECSVLSFPSVREFGGGVVLEAMALGLAPLIVAYGGPDELVTEDTGFKVPLQGRAGIIEGFRTELERLASTPDLVAETGKRARQRVLHLFTWNKKAEQVAKVYDWVLGETERPSFFQEA